MSKDWYERHLSRTPAPPPVQRGEYVPNSAFAPRYVPTQQPLPQIITEPRTDILRAKPQPNADGIQTHAQLMEAAAAFQGRVGPKETMHTGVCPECGHNNFFSRALDINGNPKRGLPPAPLCDNCGYNGLFTQSGTTPIDPQAQAVN